MVGLHVTVHKKNTRTNSATIPIAFQITHSVSTPKDAQPLVLVAFVNDLLAA